MQTDAEVLQVLYRHYQCRLHAAITEQCKGPVDMSLLTAEAQHLVKVLEQRALCAETLDCKTLLHTMRRLWGVGFGPLSGAESLIVHYGTSPLVLTLGYGVNDHGVTRCYTRLYLPKPPYKPHSGTLDNPALRVVGEWSWGTKLVWRAEPPLEEVIPLDMSRIIWGK